MIDVKVRLPYAMRCTGKPLKSGQMFSAVMNFPPPDSNFQCHTDMLQKSPEVECENSKETIGEDVKIIQQYVTEGGTSKADTSILL